MICGRITIKIKYFIGEEFDKTLLEELIIYEDISKQPARVKCATLGIDGIMDILKESK